MNKGRRPPSRATRPFNVQDAPPIGSIPLHWFVCPVTKERLAHVVEQLMSSVSTYPRDAQFGFWSFMPKNILMLHTKEWRGWDILQRNSFESGNAGR